jgi:hypothetical protein
MLGPHLPIVATMSSDFLTRLTDERKLHKIPAQLLSGRDGARRWTLPAQHLVVGVPKRSLHSGHSRPRVT